MNDVEPILLEPVPPVGSRRTNGFASRTDGTCGFQSWDEPVYPAHPDGEAFRALRLAARLSIREAARRLGLHPSEVSGLEFGRLVPLGGWDALRERLRGDRR